MNYKPLVRVFGKFLVVVVFMGLSCGTGIVVGRGQQQFLHFTRMRTAVELIIASDPEFKSVTCHESSSCRLFVQGNLTEDQQTRFIETVLRQVGEIHSEQFTFSFKTPSP